MALPKLGCSRCNKDGYTIGDKGEIITCECIIRKRLHAVYEAIGIPRPLYDAKIEDYKINETGLPTNSEAMGPIDARRKEDVRDRVILYCSQMGQVFMDDEDFTFGGGDTDDEIWTGRTIALCGGRGSGKSLLAVVIAKAAIKLGIAPKIFQWADVIEACYDFNRDDDNDFELMVKSVERAKPIIIENFSTDYENRRLSIDPKDRGWLNPITKRRIDSLFTPVYQRGLVAVITTSLTPEELNTQEAYGPVMSSILTSAHKIRLPSKKLTGDHNTMKQRSS